MNLIFRSSNIKKTTVNLSISDSKGRDVGVIITKSDMITESAPADAKIFNAAAGITAPNKHYFGVRVQKTKNGKIFGASQPTRYFASEADTKKYIEARIRNIKKQ